MGMPILVGWLLDHTAAGLMASIGGFTSLYGSGRAYLSRARHLGAIAIAFALCVGIGLAVSPSPWLVVFAVASIAMIATWLSNALQIGPPGAYMFTLACAAGTGMQGVDAAPLHGALLVFAGGAFAWLVQMGGALFNPRGPERNAVAAAANAVIAYAEASGTPRGSAARHRAAFALHNAWSVLINQQPTARVGDEVRRLRALNRQLHLLFADTLGAAIRGEQSPASVAAARSIAAQIRNPETRADNPHPIPMAHPGPLDALMEALRPGSNAFRVIVRVGVAAIVVGTLGALLHVERAYWAVAATVLMLHQGFDWIRMLQRSIERLLGTWIGLALAGVILIVHPQGLWLVLTIMVLQFTIEMLVVRNYALAAIFITGAALTIASGGQRIDELMPYLLARGVDTFAGCAIALVIFRLLPPLAAVRHIPDRLIETLQKIDATIPHLARGDVTSKAARAARRDLQRANFALAAAHDDSVFASRAERRQAEYLWPTIAAIERLAYRTLTTCWSLEQRDESAARAMAAEMFSDEDIRNVRATLADFIDTLRNRCAPASLSFLPDVLEREFIGAHESLSRDVSNQA